MFDAFVESGRLLALDLGGTNFRVLLVDLNGTEEPITTSQLFLIPKRIMLGEGYLVIFIVLSNSPVSLRWALTCRFLSVLEVNLW